MENLHALFAQSLVVGQKFAMAGFVLLLALVERFDYNNRSLQLGLQGYFVIFQCNHNYYLVCYWFFVVAIR
jgi:hypothetical protein